MNSRVVIVLPTLNEERSIESVIDEIPVNDLVKRGYEVEILVIDGNSSDMTREIASKKGATVLLQSGVGKGSAIAEVFLEIESDYVFMMDADGTYPANSILDMLEQLEKGNEVVTGSRFLGRMQNGSMSFTHEMGNRLLTWIASILFSRNVTDVCTGMWGFRREAIKLIQPVSQGFDLEAELFAESVRHDLSLREIPINYRKRISASKLHGMRAGISIISRLARTRMAWR